MGSEPRAQLFIVSGPSGSGKTTVVEHLLREVPGLLFSVSCTTRAPRAGEQDGRDYHYIKRAEFERMISAGDFLEYANVFGELYGTPRRNLEQAGQQGKDLVLDIDVQGARQVKSQLPQAVAILLVPPSAAVLEQRLRQRAQDSPDIIRRRLDRAREEIESYSTYDYMVVNRDLAETCSQVKAIVLAERHRRTGARATPEDDEGEARAAAARRETNKGQISAILETFAAKKP